MKVEINSIEIKEDSLNAVFSFSKEIDGFEKYRSHGIQERVEEILVRRLADKIWEERGPAILEAITNNQLMNAIIMKVAGTIGGGRNN